jgi:hypothetical protein
LPTIYFSVILSFILWTSKLSLFFGFPHQVPLCISPLKRPIRPVISSSQCDYSTWLWRGVCIMEILIPTFSPAYYFLFLRSKYLLQHSVFDLWKSWQLNVLDWKKIYWAM